MKIRQIFSANPNDSYHSPALLGFLTLFLSYFGLAVTEDPNSPFIPGWVWISGAPILLIGIGVQFLTKRVLWIRSYHALITVHAFVIYAFALWSIQERGQTGNSPWVSVAIVIGVAVGSLMTGYLLSAKRTRHAASAPGALGVLNAKTGYVDPQATPKEIEREEATTARVRTFLTQWSPLFIGVLMAVGRITGSLSQAIVPAIVAMLGLMLGGWGVSSNMFYISSILRWERQNRKRIYLR